MAKCVVYLLILCLLCMTWSPGHCNGSDEERSDDDDGTRQNDVAPADGSAPSPTEATEPDGSDAGNGSGGGDDPPSSAAPAVLKPLADRIPNGAWTMKFTKPGIDAAVAQMGNTKARDLAALSKWKSELTAAKWLVLTVDTDLADFAANADRVKPIEDMFEALKDKELRVTLDLHGQSSVTGLPFHKLKISWLDLDGTRRWTGNAIFGAWYGPAATRPPLLRLDDVSPQEAGAAAEKHFEPLLISNRVALLTSHVHGQYLRARVMAASAVGQLVPFIQERQGTAVGSLTVDVEEGLFEQTWTGLRATLRPFGQFVVQDTNQRNRHRNRSTRDGAKSNMYFSDGQSTGLVSGSHTIELTLNRAYGTNGKGNAAVDAIAKSLAKYKGLRHLTLDDRVHLLEKIIDMTRGKKPKALADLETVTAFFGDHAKLLHLPALGALEDFTLDYKAEKDGEAAKFKTAIEKDKEWKSANCQAKEKMKCMRFVNAGRKEKREKGAAAGASAA